MWMICSNDSFTESLSTLAGAFTAYWCYLFIVRNTSVNRNGQEWTVQKCCTLLLPRELLFLAYFLVLNWATVQIYAKLRHPCMWCEWFKTVSITQDCDVAGAPPSLFTLQVSAQSWCCEQKPKGWVRLEAYERIFLRSDSVQLIHLKDLWPYQRITRQNSFIASHVLRQWVYVTVKDS